MTPKFEQVGVAGYGTVGQHEHFRTLIQKEMRQHGFQRES